MFPKKYRLTKKEDFDRIYKNSYTYNLNYFRVSILKNNLDKNRFCVVVSKKVSQLATDRNRIKRRLRYTLFSNQAIFPTNIDLLIMVTNRNILNTNSADLQAEFLFLSKKLKNRS
ncbi:MAG: hypothetical protein ACD_7C00086G0024 [uncultured bacterium]|nr:MAG: hypothetical protein ACD_7C00086G0024 [uncultured bacterium]HBR79766.1 ribonuclease P protein component [Candidatus Moranbacteria bacterium]